MLLWYDACKELWQEGIMKTPFLTASWYIPGA